jgi:hypothetical protein
LFFMTRASGFQFRWVIADAADKRYLMRADTENF